MRSDIARLGQLFVRGSWMISYPLAYLLASRVTVWREQFVHVVTVGLHDYGRRHDQVDI
jgi:ABC-type spermidine/putrescine transport system permease subunit I